MIIVKTKNGDRFINDAETLQVSHIKDKETVEVWPSKWAENHMCEIPNFSKYSIPQSFEIRNVEAVIYTNAAQPVQWKDEGSEVERLAKENRDRKEYIYRLTKRFNAVKDDLLHFAHHMAEIVSHYHDKIPSDICKQIQSPALNLKEKVLRNEYNDS